ncbi:AAA family ATPase [Nocardia sp. NPDC052278]|uniref:NACHT and WD repeat domain-containing protein n=1 Tax=unclassified Nocardia TaxID=2637762 RepID=UPI00367A81FE
MVAGETTAEARGEIRSPRAVFAHRFADLYAAAGNPTLRRVATAAGARMRAAQGTRATASASVQRISDWKAGRNVPARFESLLPVVLTLIDLAKKAESQTSRQLLEVREWQRLWQAAITWTPNDEDDAGCPYLGLTSYRKQHRDLFFGRTRSTAELVDLVQGAAADADGVVVLIGASGAGKSSLLAAGLIPAVTDNWSTATMTPGARPLRALAKAFHADSTIAEPSADEVCTALDQWSAEQRRLLIVDQFEELFTACPDEREREALRTRLTLWDISNPDRPVRMGTSPPEHSPLMLDVIMHPDGRTAVTVANETFQVWDISNPASPEPIGDRVTAHNLAIISTSFSPDGKTLATSGNDGMVRLWDFTDRRHPRLVSSSIAPPGPNVWFIQFHPQGDYLSASSSGGERRLWDLDEQHAIERICHATATLMTPELWQRYLPQLSYRPPCD